MFFGLSLRHGYSSEHPSVGIRKVHAALDEVGLPADEETILKHLKKIAMRKRPAKAELEYRRAKNGAG